MKSGDRIRLKKPHKWAGELGELLYRQTPVGLDEQGWLIQLDNGFRVFVFDDRQMEPERKSVNA